MDTQAQIKQCNLEQVRELLALAEGDDVQGVGLDNILHNCNFYILQGDGGKLALALMPIARELWVQAAGGLGNSDLTRAGLEHTEERAAAGGFQSVGFQTRRKGLVKKAQAQGYQIDGYILRKKIK